MILRPKHVSLSALLVLCVVLSVTMLSFAYYSNGGYGFPLDDPWIHLQFAKNLQEHGSFSYFQDEVVTSGSTAPLYTLLLSAGFMVTNDEMMLSYVLGVFFLLLSVAYFVRFLEHQFAARPLLLFGGALLLILEPRLQWAGLSGMETTLFILLALATADHWFRRQSWQTGIAAGLLLWTRPEALILFIALACEAVYEMLVQKKNSPTSRTWLFPTVGIFLFFAIGYGLFNILLSGSILPNTYAAKLAYYTSGGRDYSLQVVRFLSQGHMIAIAFFALAGVVLLGIKLFRRERTALLVPVLFTVGMILAFGIKLPYLYQNGRYLMPVLPFVLFVGLAGFDWLFDLLGKRAALSERGKRIARSAIIGYLSVHFLIAFWEGRAMYQDYCRYIAERQVRTAHWIREHLPRDAVVATHDVGAIAFYSERRIVDMVGLISPEMIRHIGNLDGLRAFLVKSGVTHLALLRNWFEVVNVKPVFQTDERTPEIMEVFEFDTTRVHFTTSEVSHLTDLGWQYIMRGNAERGGPLVERAVLLDSLSSRAHHHLGWALMMIGELDRAEEEFRKALALYPEYWTARFALAQVSIRRGRPQEAIGRLTGLIQANPSMGPAYQLLAQVYGQVGDTTRARQMLERLRQLEAEGHEP